MTASGLLIALVSSGGVPAGAGNLESHIWTSNETGVNIFGGRARF